MKRFKIELTDTEVRIYDPEGNEVIMWTEEEWQEDSDVVFSIVNAIQLALTNPAELLRIVGKIRPEDKALPVVRALWDALSDILEEVYNEDTHGISDELREQGLKAIEMAQTAFPKEA